MELEKTCRLCGRSPSGFWYTLFDQYAMCQDCCDRYLSSEDDPEFVALIQSLDKGDWAPDSNRPVVGSKTVASRSEAMNPRDARRYHAWSDHHVNAIFRSKVCGCFACFCRYGHPARKSHWTWIDDGETALCPVCGIDAVLPDSAVPLTPKLLQDMHWYWFCDNQDPDEIIKRYPVVMHTITDGNCWFIYLPDFGRTACSATGDTPEEALETIKIVAQKIVRHYRDTGRELPDTSLGQQLEKMDGGVRMGWNQNTVSPMGLRYCFRISAEELWNLRASPEFPKPCQVEYMVPWWRIRDVLDFFAAILQE